MKLTRSITDCVVDQSRGERLTVKEHHKAEEGRINVYKRKAKEDNRTSDEINAEYVDVHRVTGSMLTCSCICELPYFLSLV